MKPIKFNEMNKELKKPNNMTDEECSSLYVYTDNEICISCWRLSFKEKLKALIYGKVWVGVLSGGSQPPIWLDCDNTVFVKEKENSKQ